MADHMVSAKALASRLWEMMERPLSTPSFYRDESDVWQAGYRYGLGRAREEIANQAAALKDKDCPGCGAPTGLPPAGPCRDHGTPQARAMNEERR